MPALTAYIEFDTESNTYYGVVPGIPGAHTQADTLDELRANLKEVLELVLEDYEDELPNFVATMTIDVPVSVQHEQTAHSEFLKDERRSAAWLEGFERPLDTVYFA